MRTQARTGGLRSQDVRLTGQVHRATDGSGLAERERVRLGAAFEEGDLERLLADRVVLAYGLVQAAVPEHAVSVLVDVDAC